MISLPVEIEHALSSNMFVMVKMIVKIILMSKRIAVSFFIFMLCHKLNAVSLVLLPCEGSSVRCNNTGACLPFWKACNGIDDCDDRPDEVNCKTGYHLISLVETHPITVTDCFSCIM